MIPQQIQQLERQLQEWQAQHENTEKLRAAYRRKVMAFALNSMALEKQPVDAERLQALLSQPAPQDR